MSDAESGVSSESGTQSTGPFKDPQLTAREHMDPDKHLIGESLQAPSLAEMKASGIATTVGKSNIVARADHTHDTTPYLGVMTSANKAIVNNSQAYINNLVYTNGYNYLGGSGQLLTMPVEGVYMFHILWFAQTNPANVFQGYFQVYPTFYNAVVGHYTHFWHGVGATNSITGNFAYSVMTTQDFSAGGGNNNMQILISNYLNRDINFAINRLCVWRIGAYGTTW